MSSKVFLFFRWLLFIACGISITWLSLIPNPPVIQIGFFGWDKFEHAAAYGVFALTGGWAFSSYPRVARRSWRWAVAAAAIYGGLMEIAQGMFTKARTAEWGDLLADFVGGICIYAAVMLMTRYRRNT